MLIILLLYLLFPQKVYAIPTVFINSTPDIVIAGNTFPVTFTINEASSSSSYYYKFFGGAENDIYSIKNNPNLSYTSGWDNFPQITLNPNNSNIYNEYAYINSTDSTRTFNIKIKIALISNTKISITSPSYTFEVIPAPPTPTPTPIPPTNTPTPTPTPTPIPPTHTPTPTPKVLTPTPTPKPTITPTPENIISENIIESTISPIIEPRVDENQNILGETDVDTNYQSTNQKQNYLPLVFIILGGALLITPLIISKVKKQ